MLKLNLTQFLFVIIIMLLLQEAAFSQTSSLPSLIQTPGLEHGHKKGVLHEIFESGGEIFYRRSENYGSTWNVDQKISDTVNVSEKPSISAGYSYQSPNLDVLRIVWQQKIDNYNYRLWYVFSNDGGSIWSTPQIIPGCSKVVVGDKQSNANSGQGPTPVVSTFVEFYSENICDFILVYAAHDGLHYKLCYQNRNNWLNPYNGDIVPGTLNNNSVCFPSLVTYDGREYHIILTYNDGLNHVCSQIFSANMTWSTQDTIELSDSNLKKLSAAESGSNNIKNYTLSQNFPNPFNPSTTISYSISERAPVTLKIYDILGNEIETLVNEEKPAGNYQVQFNASLLASGTYIYKIQAGSFIQTKKMILLR